MNIAVDPALLVAAGHDIAEDAHYQLLHNLKYLSNATVHVEPVRLAGEEYYRHGIGNTEHQESHVNEHGEHGHSHDLGG